MGDPLTVVELDPKAGSLRQTVLGTDLSNGQVPQHVVPPGVWFGCYPTLDYAGAGDVGSRVGYSLVGCTVAPGFDFADFELAKQAQLLKTFPQHVEAVKRLTDSSS